MSYSTEKCSRPLCGLLCIFCLFVLPISGSVFPSLRQKGSDDDDQKDLNPDKNFPPPVELEKQANYWHEKAKEILREKKKYGLKDRPAKNIIFFLGDGMSITTLTAARIYQGQLNNKSGEEDKLFFETFPHSGLAKTYCVDAQVADSACTATAFMTGVKTNIGAIGVTSNVTRTSCELGKNPEMRPSSLMKWAQEAGKGTGVVTTTRITHATPAGAYAHVPNRGMESDAFASDSKMNLKECDYDIATQLVTEEPGKNMKVLLGGGWIKFLPKTYEIPTNGRKGERLDGVDLIEEWHKEKTTRNQSAAVAYTAGDLNNVDPQNTDYLLGLFAESHLDYHSQGNQDQPTLAEMTAKAISMLRKEKSGFVLLVEGGRIDTAHHSNLAHTALDETLEFAKAIETAFKMTDKEETLIVVTADHSHVMTMSGYPLRGTDIFKFAGKDRNNLPFATLSYANGPGYNLIHNSTNGGNPTNLSEVDMHSWDFVFPAMVNLTGETHSGEDVAVYASGPWSHLFTGNYEQNYLPIAEAFAANIGPVKDETKDAFSSAATCYSYQSIVFTLITLNFFYIAF